jgi:RNA polymerase sigma-70 factor (ECF subfamily)
MPVDEALLIVRAQKNDSAAIEALIYAYEKRVYNIAFRFMGNEADAWDMAQESLIKIYKSVSSFKSRSSFSSWVYRLTANTCLDGLRKRKKAPLSLDHTVESGASYEDASNPLPEDYALKAERSKDIQKALDKLSSDHKAVIILRDISGLSYEEIAESLGLSIGTVKSRINRGRAKLKELLIQY